MLEKLQWQHFCEFYFQKTGVSLKHGLCKNSSNIITDDHTTLDSRRWISQTETLKSFAMHQESIKSTCSWIAATGFALKKKRLINTWCISHFSQLPFSTDNGSARAFYILMHILATFHKTTCSKFCDSELVKFIRNLMLRPIQLSVG